MFALRELNPDKLKWDARLDQGEGGAARSTGRVASVEFDDHDQRLRGEWGKRPKDVLRSVS